ncbi:formate dehydrogenase subunit gamma [Ferrimonas pelagia]|uniref:Formate dehydrogenase subunit gamma n=1 Tax=Ferrimonas pelagia TaxID=1177826 RepID=A0ABP9F0E9_9GAMM
MTQHTVWRFLLALLFSLGLGGAMATETEGEEQLVQAIMAAQAAEIDGGAGDLSDKGVKARPFELDPTWLAVKNGEQGRTQAQGEFHRSLINSYDPRLISARPSWIAPALALALFGMILVFALFVLVNGAAKLEKGFSGVEVLRWSKFDIFVHWLMAIPCLLLIVTGLSLLAGRFVFGSVLGPDGVGALAAIAKPVHDYMAIPFAIGAVLAMVRWMKHNIPAGYDLKWFMVVGGYLNFGPFKGKHPDAGFSNAGEKLWFWSFTIFGLAVIGSGAIMLFPDWFSPSRTTSLMAIVVHGASAIVLTGFTVVHIFMATVLSEGGFPCMTSGYCDENWAKQHHNVWYDDIKAEGTLKYKET